MPAVRHTLPLPAQLQSASWQERALESQNQINLNTSWALRRQMKPPRKTRTLSRCSFPPELLVQIRKCFVNKKHCLSPSFFKDSEPRRTLLSFPLSTEGTWIREPGEGKWRTDSNYNLARTMPLAIHTRICSPKIPRIYLVCLWNKWISFLSPTEETCCILRNKLFLALLWNNFNSFLHL